MIKKVKLHEIVKIAGRVGWKGYTVEDLRDEGPWVIGANDITSDNRLDLSKAKHISREKYEESPEIKIDLNDILIVKVGSTIGKVAIVNREIGEACINPNSVILKNCKINPSYLYYYLISSAGKSFLRNNSSASAQSALNQMTLKEMLIDIVDENTQVNISSILNNLNSKIELNNRINAELEAMAKMIYDYWFVQFDFPFDFAQGKPDKNGKPYKSSGGKMVWSEELKREIPQGWEVNKMEDWIECKKSGDWGKEVPDGNSTLKVTCFRGADINGLNGLTELKPPIRYILEKNSFKILNAHDIIIEISGGSPTQSTGRLAYITDSTIKRFDTPLICSNFCKPISLKNPKLLYNFVYYWNSLYDNGIFFGYEGKTSGIKNLLFDSFVSSYYTVVPEQSIVNEFYDFMENIQNKKQTALAENQKLTELRDWLLPMLMNGQVKVNEIEHA
ncbi:restriction endonuclease subunit S [Candidatus Pollutiaquabacter sp.]|uniref:restriction endonuclease subunit S n=1 Tax=Candidatus Pollutiaquabacter sp. TaxID=3416354 RepID=UPI003CAAAFCD|nr:restriction endonuclease subunit S [Bacteroidota bacterium]